MQYIPRDLLAEWTTPKGFRASLTDIELGRLRKSWSIGLEITKALHSSGSRLLIGTDTPNPLNVPGYSVHEELQQFVLAGLSPFEAIAAGTRDPAEFLGEAAAFGTVAIGKRADLLLLAANPLMNVSNTTRRAGVMLRGRWFTGEDLDHRLAELAAALKTQ